VVAWVFEKGVHIIIIYNLSIVVMICILSTYGIEVIY
jgi:hypothetical protein